MPLSLLEYEEKGKQTTFKCSILNLECKVKSQNNRSANVLRRKVLDAKEKLAENVRYLFIRIVIRNHPSLTSPLFLWIDHHRAEKATFPTI